MNGFALLWGKILESSLWVKESKETRLVWITLLAMKNSEGDVYASMVGLADRAKVSPDECRKALEVLKAPDLDDTSKVDDGRRVREIHGGWHVINHDLYRFSTEAKRELWRQQKQEQRAKEAKAKAEMEARKVLKRSRPTAVEEKAAKMRAAGHTEKEIEEVIGNMPAGKFPESHTHQPAPPVERVGVGLMEGEFGGEKEE